MNAALRILPLAFLWVCASARAEDLLVLERSAADHEASTRLRELHDEPARVLEDAEASDPAHALAQGRAHGAQRVVVFDGAHVSVLHTASGEQVTRSTTDPTAYTAAFVAAELLAIRPAPPPPPPPPPPTWRLALRLGVQLWVGPPFPLAPRAELGIGVQHALGRLELNVATPARSEHGGVQRTRTDLGLRGALFLVERERFRLAASAHVGAGWVRARIDEPGLPTHSRAVFTAHLGLEPNVVLTPWLSLYALAALQGSTPRAEYRVAGGQAARESPLGLVLGLGLWLTPPFR
ncbi:MAG: hypothetical protein ABW352_07180 [Polyangiales bacterium]